MKLQEAKIAEAMFLDPIPKPKSTKEDEVMYGGARISLRQQQKRERALKKLREKEAAEALIGKELTYCLSQEFE